MALVNGLLYIAKMYSMLHKNNFASLHFIVEHMMAGWPETEALEDLATPSTTCYKKPPEHAHTCVGHIHKDSFNMLEDEFVEL
jgi:hypothetical protein